MSYSERNNIEREEIAHMEIHSNEPRREVVTETHPPVVNPVVNYHDRVRWGPIVAGLFIAIACQLVLSALAIAVGLTTGLGATGVGIWAIVNIFVSLLIGGWVLGRTSGPMNKKTALLNGAVLWGLALGVSAWLVASGVSGAFGIVADTAGGVISGVAGNAEIAEQAQDPGVVGELRERAPNLDTGNLSTGLNRATEVGTAGAWGFVIGSLFALVAAMIGASAGARKPRRNGQNTEMDY